MKRIFAVLFAILVLSCVAFATQDIPSVLPESAPDSSSSDIPDSSSSGILDSSSSGILNSSSSGIPDVEHPVSIPDLAPILGVGSAILGFSNNSEVDQPSDLPVISCSCDYDFGSSFVQLNTLLLLLFLELGVIATWLFCKR